MILQRTHQLVIYRSQSAQLLTEGSLVHGMNKSQHRLWLCAFDTFGMCLHTRRFLETIGNKIPQPSQYQQPHNNSNLYTVVACSHNSKAGGCVFFVAGTSQSAINQTHVESSYQLHPVILCECMCVRVLSILFDRIPLKISFSFLVPWLHL